MMCAARKIIIFVFVFFTHSACAKYDCDTINKIQASLKQNKPVAIIIADQNIKEDIEFSDAYGDWVEYWNDFIQGTRGKYLHIKLSPKKVPTIFKEYAAFKDSISYVFIGKNISFYYPGPIYEPQVYYYVEKYFSNKTISKRISSYKPVQFTLQLHECN